VDRQGHHRSGARQRGITLVVGLIMLILVTLLVLATFHLGKSNLEIIGNVQHRNEALGAADQTIEAAISSTLLTTNPASVFPAPCQGPNTLCYDVNGDGSNDVLVTLTPQPTCVKAQVIKTASLDLSQENDRRCTVQAGQTGGIEGTTSNDSLCSNSLWDLVAVAADIDPNTNAPVVQGATAVINQGVAVRVRTTDVMNSCP
jgi:Tfp pilus assembly protein PilX